MKDKEVGPDPLCSRCSGTGRHRGTKKFWAKDGTMQISRWDFGCWKCNYKAPGGLPGNAKTSIEQVPLDDTAYSEKAEYRLSFAGRFITQSSMIEPISCQRLDASSVQEDLSAMTKEDIKTWFSYQNCSDEDKAAMTRWREGLAAVAFDFYDYTSKNEDVMVALRSLKTAMMTMNAALVAPMPKGDAEP